MGESQQVIQIVDYPNEITLGYQMISIVGSKVREALSTSINLQTQTSTPQSKDMRRLHKGQVPMKQNDATLVENDLPQLTLQDVSFHDSSFDCWVIIYDRVYDITNFLQEHPGGEEVMLEHAGRDATLAFRSVGHSKLAEESLKQYLVGNLVEEERIWTRFFKLVSGTRT